jgi:hypothetical protein
MRIALLLSATALATGCSSGNLKTPDLGTPRDMSTPAIAAIRIASATTLANCLAADAAHVYWSDSSSGAPQIVSLPLAGGTATPLVTGGDANACVAVDGDGVYYFEDTKVMKVPLAGGTATPLASGQHLLKNTPLVVSAGNVYWITDVYGNVDAFSGKNAIVRVATSANNATPTVVSADIGINAGGLAVDATTAYYGDGGGLFARTLADPATATKIVQLPINPPAFAVGTGRVLVAEVTTIGAGDIAIYRPDGMGRMQLADQLGKPFAVDDQAAYVGFSGSLERLPLDGSAAVRLGAVSARALALAPGAVIFTDGTALWSAPR